MGRGNIRVIRLPMPSITSGHGCFVSACGRLGTMGVLVTMQDGYGYGASHDRWIHMCRHHWKILRFPMAGPVWLQSGKLIRVIKRLERSDYDVAGSGGVPVGDAGQV